MNWEYLISCQPIINSFFFRNVQDCQQSFYDYQALGRTSVKLLLTELYQLLFREIDIEYEII